MPKGHVTWCDPEDGNGVVEHAGRRYAVAAGGLPRDARSAGAPVHFDISHQDAGDVAVNVTSRGGTRTSRRTQRHGDLTGARSPSTKRRSGPDGAGPLPHEHTTHETQPRQLVDDWVWLLRNDETDGAAALYAPDAVVEIDDGPVAGQREIRRHLVTAPWANASADVQGLQGNRFRVVWHTDGPTEELPVVTLRIEHGRIVEHTEAVVPPEGRGTGPAAPDSTQRTPVQTAVVHGHVSAHAVSYAEDKVREVMEYAPAPVLYARLALAHDESQALASAAVAKATLDVNGQPVRAHVASATVPEAADLLKERLRRGLDALGQRRQTRRLDTGESGEGEWRHGDLPTDRPDYFPRPREEREIVRHKTWTLDELTAEEATLDLDVLDLDWLLFTELHTGADAVIERAGDGYRLRLSGDDLPPTDDLAFPVQVVSGVPTRSVEQAVDDLDVGDLPFVFFIDDASDRGAVVYRRYDGHYGLVVAASDAAAPDEDNT